MIIAIINNWTQPTKTNDTCALSTINLLLIAYLLTYGVIIDKMISARKEKLSFFVANLEDIYGFLAFVKKYNLGSSTSILKNSVMEVR